MTRRRHIMPIVLTAAFLHSMTTSAQQSPIYSQYSVNAFTVNPAMVGIDGTVRLSVSAHDYLIGMHGGPMTFTLAGSGRILKSRASVENGKYVPAQTGHVGLGGIIFSDCNGLVKRVGTQFTYGYHIDLNQAQTSMLSFGLSAAISQTRIDAAKLEFDETEPMLNEGFKNVSYVPDAVLGIVYRYKQHYVGLTASNLFQRSIRFGEFDYDYVLYRHFFLIAGTTVQINEKWFFSPSLFGKYASNNVYQGEIAARFDYRNDFWAAVIYRTPSIASLMVGFHKGPFYFGYNYEYNFNELRTFKGAQEFIVMYRFGDTTRRYRWGTRF